MPASANSEKQPSRAPVQEIKEAVSATSCPDRRKLYEQLPDNMNAVFTKLKAAGIALEDAIEAPEPDGKAENEQSSPQAEYEWLKAVVLEISRHPLQRALPPRYGCWPKEARPIGHDLHDNFVTAIAANKADGRTKLTSDELAVVQENWFAWLKALDPQFKVPKYTPGVPLVDADMEMDAEIGADVDNDGDTVMDGGGPPAVSDSVPPSVARTETATLAVDDSSDGESDGENDDDDDYHKFLEEMEHFSWLGVGSNARGMQ
jgi:hypothetical protein